jgi:hypothetical protein
MSVSCHEQTSSSVEIAKTKAALGGTVTKNGIHFWKISLTPTPGIVDQVKVAKTSIHWR